MTERERKEIQEYIDEAVKKAVSEVRRHKLLKESSVYYAEVSDALFRYYQEGESNSEVADALVRIESDDYFRIIPWYYRDKMTIEAIADGMEVDISTVVRNKKRLCLKLEL